MVSLQEKRKVPPLHSTDHRFAMICSGRDHKFVNGMTIHKKGYGNGGPRSRAFILFIFARFTALLQCLFLLNARTFGIVNTYCHVVLRLRYERD
jgi:hypothetical protein